MGKKGYLSYEPPRRSTLLRSSSTPFASRSLFVSNPTRRSRWIAVGGATLAVAVWLVSEFLSSNPTAANTRPVAAIRPTTIAPKSAVMRALPRSIPPTGVTLAPAEPITSRSAPAAAPPRPAPTAAPARTSPAASEPPPTPVERPTTPAEPARSWVHYEVRHGDTLGRIFEGRGLDAADAVTIAELNHGRLRRLSPGDVLRLDVDADGRLRALEYPLSPVEYLSVARAGDAFVAQELSRPFEVQERRVGGTITSSLFKGGYDAGLSDSVILEFASIFRWTIDFARDLRSGDEFALIYEEKSVDGRPVAGGTILAAMLKNNGKVHRAIRHVTADDRVAYYSPEGDGLQRAFLRTPVSFTRISSNFSKRRYHPVLKTWRSHKGVDYAAASGTPVYATGDGKVTLVGRKGGYGKTVIIQHADRRSTLYAHLSGYHRDLRAGQRIRQGQTIGYVGSTGLATGPHLHYEFQINGVHRDPLTVELPRSQPVPESERSAFLAKAAVWVAELEQQGETLLTQAAFSSVGLR